jgi:hypothetical protein
MVKIKTKYIVLFWILLLILFTFYCIFRIKYISDKIQEKYANTPLPKPSSTSGSVIDWVDNIDKTAIITDIKGCEYVYDDNIGVGILGYSDCKTAYNDYVEKSFDVNNKFGQSKSLAEICPVSTKSPLYAQCLTQLAFKFTNGANIIDNVNSEMANLLNTRLSERNAVVNSVNNDMNSFMTSSSQNDFSNFMKTNDAVAKTPDDVFNLVGNYYGNRFDSGYNIGYKKSVEGFSNRSKPVEQSIVDLFFGYYKPLSGQFLVLDNINISLSYDTTNSEQVQTQPETQSENSSQSANQAQQNNIILTVTNSDGFQMIANVDSINKFKDTLNSIIIKLSDINITNNPTNSQTLQQLLSILGVTELTYLIMTYEEYTSTENILHKTYKLVNENLDTILLFNKI